MEAYQASNPLPNWGEGVNSNFFFPSPRFGGEGQGEGPFGLTPWQGNEALRRLLQGSLAGCKPIFEGAAYLGMPIGEIGRAHV